MDKLENEVPVLIPSKTTISPKDFDAIYSLSEDKMLEVIINKELDKVGMSDRLSLVPEYIIRRKNVMISIFSASIFFHFSINVYIIEFVVLFVYILVYAFFTKFSFMKYLIKKVKESPKEKISSIVMTAKNDINSKYNNSKTWLYIIIPIVLALVIFIKPRIFYEEVDG